MSVAPSIRWKPVLPHLTPTPLRRYFVKGGNLNVYTEADLRVVEDRLNSCPREILGWRTPAEVLGKQ
ncbi:MAG: Integrase catalytic protein [Actinomycetota bacterium]|nr:Integrase catalytic protein [Actinomycetota bacterium]